MNFKEYSPSFLKIDLPDIGRRHAEMVLYGIIVILVCMKGWKENSSLTESMNDAYEWMSSHLLVKYGIFVFIAFVFTHIFDHFDLFYTESDSAQYLISALVQSQAAIIGIVITLTFIAVQLIFSYSPRAVGVALKRNYDMWMLLFFYGISIFYGLFVLRMIPNDLDGYLSQIDLLTLWGSTFSLEYRICFVYCLGIFTFVAIAPYLLYTINFLKPDNIIKFLSHDITESKILKHVKSVEEHKKDRTVPIEEDPVQPIVDMIHGSVMKYDIATTSIGINAIADRAIDVIDSHSFSISAEFKNDLYPGSISKEFKSEFEKKGHPLVGSLTVEMIDITGKKWRIHDESARELYRVIVDTNEELTGLIDLGTEIKVSEHFCRHFKEIIRLTAKEDEAPTIYVIKNLKSLGRLTAEKKLEYATKEVLRSLIEWIGVITERGFEGATSRTINSLRSIGKVAAENKLEDAASRAIEFLDMVGRDAVESGHEKAVWSALEALGQVGRTAAENELHHAAAEAARDLVFFGKFEIEKEQKKITKRVLWHLEQLGTIAVEKREEPEPVTWQVLKPEVVIKQVAQSFIEIGLFSIENIYSYAAQESVRALAKLTTSSEEVVNVVIQDYESTIREECRDYFQKFLNLYELELKKPHPRNSN